LRVFSLETLRDRIGSRLRGLGGGARDLPERQQTLRATIDWSYQLLTADEQRLFELLGAFWGADVVAVERVASGSGIVPADADAIDALASLVDKSLVRRSTEGIREPRFEMLESVREFAAERLDDRPADASRVRSAHATHYAGWAASHSGDDARTDRAATVAAIATELENLRAAWRWSVEAGDLGRLEGLLGGLRTLYDAKGWYRAINDLATDVVGVLDTLERTPERDVLAIAMRSDQARALTALEGYTPEVEAAYERLLASVPSTDVPRVYPILRGLASLHSLRMENEKANQLADRILQLGREQADPAMEVDGLLLIGMGRSFDGRITDGIPDLEAGIAIAARHRYGTQSYRLGPDARVSAHTALSLLRWWEGRMDRSLEHSRSAVAMAEGLGHPSSLGYALFHAALLRLWRDEPDQAREIAVRAIEVADEHDLRIWKAVGNVVLGASAVELGPGDDGLRWMEDGLESYRGLHAPPIFWPFLLQIRATAFGRTGRIADGLASVEEAMAVAPMVDLHLVKGDLLHAGGTDREAAEAYGRAIAAARGWGAATSELRALVRLCALDLPGGPSIEARRREVGRALAGFVEGLDAPHLLAARAIGLGP
jgi:hypothetical protein